VPTVSLTFTTLPEHVRTARLVAAAVARRHGLTEDVLDEIRLAVGEACARAVGRAQDAGREGVVRVEILEPADRFVVVVHEAGDAGFPTPAVSGGDAVAGTVGENADQVSLTIVRALADEVETGAGDGPDDMDGAHAAPAGALRLVWRL
jgi:anti-sigma regulatory factor (Ser/Thr protein kinase)